MRKVGQKSAESPAGGASASKGGRGWFENKKHLGMLIAIAAVAFVLRVVFAYGTSMGQGAALSGGTSATTHLNTIVSILNGSFSFTDMSANYPVGASSPYPILMDVIFAAFAMIAQSMGSTATDAASIVLAGIPPVLAALTCIPVYFIAKRIFRNEDIIGLLAALLYGTFGLLVVSTVFSNGTEYAFVGFLFAWMVLFLLRGLDAQDSSNGRSAIINSAIAGIFLALIALSWNEFRVIVVAMVAFIGVQVLVDRFRHKDMRTDVLIYALPLIIGLVIALPYYFVAGLWETVFSGVFILGMLAAVLGIAFAYMSKVSWVVTIPAFIIIAAVISVVLYFAAPDLFAAVIHGNNYYEGELMQNAVVSGKTSISAYASYYGWLTLWFAPIAAVWMLYKYRENLNSRKYLFTIMFFLAFFVAGWYSVSNAIIAGAAIAVAAAGSIVFIIRKVGLRTYFAEIKGGDMKMKVKKVLRPVPFATVVLAVVLVAAPNVMSAYDAAVPTNADSDDTYFNGLSYTIATLDTDVNQNLWNDYADKDKSGALVTWITQANDARNKGGFTTVTDNLGGGTAAMSNILLASSSDASVAAMMARLLLADPSLVKELPAEFQKAIGDYIEDPESARAYVMENPTQFPGHTSAIDAENAQYLCIVDMITSGMDSKQIEETYTAMGKGITYVSASGAMIPLSYRDGSSFSTIAYFGGYATGTYGAITNFYTINPSTGYDVYTDAMYETFLWKALIGPSASFYSEASSISYLSDLSLSDGKVKAIPGFGLPGYKVASWFVSYNPADDATHSTDGWKVMDGFEAIELQKQNGGVINYLSGTVLMEYVGLTGGQYTTVHVDVGSDAMSGVSTEVYVYDDTFDSYRLYSSDVTDAEGNATIAIPDTGAYQVQYRVGAKTVSNGTLLKSWDSTYDATYTINKANVTGAVYFGDNTYEGDAYITFVGTTTGTTYDDITYNGAVFTVSDMVPDVYTVTVYVSGATVLGTKTLTVVSDISDARLELTSYNITVTVTNQFGNSSDLNKGTIKATNESTGISYEADVVNGKAIIKVPTGKYTLTAINGIAALKANTGVNVSSSSGASSSMTVFDAKEITVTGCYENSVVYAYYGESRYMATSDGSGVAKFYMPISPVADIGYTFVCYKDATIGDDSVRYAVASADTSMSADQKADKITGTVKAKNGTPVSSATVTFYNTSIPGSQFVFTTDSNGKYVAYVPDAGAYTIYVFGGSEYALLNTKAFEADETLDIPMDDGRKLTYTQKYYSRTSSQGTNQNLGLAPVEFRFTDNGYDYALKKLTDATGKTTPVVPKNVEVKAVIEPTESEYFIVNEAMEYTYTSTSDSTTQYIKTVKDTPKGYSKKVTVSFSHDAKVTPVGLDSVDVTANVPVELDIGKISISIDSNGYYLDKSIVLYPGTTGTIDLDPAEVVELTVTKDDKKTDITITPVDDGTYHKESSASTDEKNVYHIEKNKEFTITAKLDGKVAIKTVNVDVDTIIDMTVAVLKETVKITGYAGVVADGTVTVYYDAVVSGTDVTSYSAFAEFKVDDGMYTLEVPKGKGFTMVAAMDQKDSKGTEYGYSTIRSVDDDAVVDKAVINMTVDSTTEKISNETKITGVSFTGGIFTIGADIKNENAYAVTYLVKAGSALNLDQSYVVNLAADEKKAFTFTGTYNPAVVGAGDANVYLVINSVFGDEIAKLYPQDMKGFIDQEGSVSVDVASKGASNSITNYEYLYAVTVNNTGSTSKTVTLNADFVVANDTCKLSIADADGYRQYGATGAVFDISGYGKTILYVKVLALGSVNTSFVVPDVKIDVTVSGGDVTTESGVVSGTTVTFDKVEPTSLDGIKLSGMTVSGGNTYNEDASIPGIVWIMIVLIVLSTIAVFWMASKRGMLSRRN